MTTPELKPLKKFYAINDPAYQDLIKHAHNYLIVDDWENVLLATYDNTIDGFIVRLNNSDEQITIWFFMEPDATSPGYIADKHQTHDDCKGNKITKPCLFAGNRIEKFYPFQFDLQGFKI